MSEKIDSIEKVKVKSIDKAKAKARQALLDVAGNYEKRKGKSQHAIEAYKEVIVASPDSIEAEKAREGLLKMAQRFEDEGKSESAYYIYKKLARELPRRAPSEPIKY